jgi:hypothetical protein
MASVSSCILARATHRTRRRSGSLGWALRCEKDRRCRSRRQSVVHTVHLACSNSVIDPSLQANDSLGSSWSISAVLDWEFAFSGSALVDVGNTLGFRASYPSGFVSGFIAGYRGELPSEWRENQRSFGPLCACRLPGAPSWGPLLH